MLFECIDRYLRLRRLLFILTLVSKAEPDQVLCGLLPRDRPDRFSANWCPCERKIQDLNLGKTRLKKDLAPWGRTPDADSVSYGWDVRS